MKIEHGKTLHKERGYAECMFGDLEMNRAIASRYDQLANSFLGTVHIASQRYWLKFVHAA
jgi:transposase